ncbi:hypothetical protein PAXINDRAFT_157855 [Paxillus involutus ATCC 200175]|uniref:Unplaced genomic scaffold PAXINscaffold_127, whole genome shotgun sequence n=1 Tax=Paxillus involutus ATCC 200175 TaxID=664439 RepID=A0A0C9TFB4_PAXIN|nr:hypothetical protein PAXINDRAFT_157855 [Paxillus involutus ATCC 200175]
MSLCHCPLCGPGGKIVTKGEKRNHERHNSDGRHYPASQYEEADMVDAMSKMNLQEHHSANLEERIPLTEEEALEEIAQGIFRVTLQDATPNPTSDGICVRRNDEHITSSTFTPVQPMPSAAAHENDDFTMILTPRGRRAESLTL